MQALYLTEFGSSAVLQYGEVFSPSLQSNEVLVKNDYIGFNFVDIYRRRRTYQIQEHHPYIDGYEMAMKGRDKLFNLVMKSIRGW